MDLWIRIPPPGVDIIKISSYKNAITRNIILICGHAAAPSKQQAASTRKTCPMDPHAGGV